MMPRYLLAVSIPLLLTAALALAALIIQIRGTLARSVLLRAGVIPEQQVRFAEAGDVILHVEGPLFTMRSRGLSFSLQDLATGQAVPSRMILYRTSSSTFSRTRLSLRRFHLPRSGAYSFRIEGLRPGVDYATCAIVFARPHGLPMVLRVLGVVLSSLTIVASLVLSILFLVEGNITFERVEGAARSGGPPVPRAQAPGGTERAGRVLPIDPALAPAWRDLRWPAVNMRFRVPTSWREGKMSDWDLDFREGDEPSPYLVATATEPPDVPVETLLDAQLAKAKADLEGGEITGYAVKRLGRAPGIVTLGMRHGGDTRMIAWTGFVDAGGEPRMVTLLLGAEDSDYDRLEPLLGAVLDSVRF